MKSFRDYLNMIDGVETVSESKNHSTFRDEQLGPMPGMRRYDGLDNSNPYNMWRFIVAAATAGAHEDDGISVPKMDPAGPIGQKMSTLAYSKADQEILDATSKMMGEPGKSISSVESTEPEGTNKTSPVRGFKGYPR